MGQWPACRAWRDEEGSSLNGAPLQYWVSAMTLVWLCLIWVFLSATVATLPMRMQYIPGAILLAAGPILIILIGFKVGFIFSVLALAAYVSMFRNPLLFLLAKLRGQNPEVPR
jgi:hypothetical protein